LLPPAAVTAPFPHQDLSRRPGGDALDDVSDRFPPPRTQLDAVVAEQAAAGGGPDEPASVLRDRIHLRERQAALEVELPFEPLQAGGIGGGQEGEQEERRSNRARARASSSGEAQRRHHIANGPGWA